jgi:hypothetical protein
LEVCGWRLADVHNGKYFCTTTTEVFCKVDIGDWDDQEEKKEGYGRQRMKELHGDAVLNWASKTWDGKGVTRMGEAGIPRTLVVLGVH